MQMIEYTTGGEGRRLGLFVHHTDAERKFAYDRKSHVGALDKSYYAPVVTRLLLHEETAGKK